MGACVRRGTYSPDSRDPRGCSCSVCHEGVGSSPMAPVMRAGGLPFCRMVAVRSSSIAFVEVSVALLVSVPSVLLCL